MPPFIILIGQCFAFMIYPMLFPSSFDVPNLMVPCLSSALLPVLDGCHTYPNLLVPYPATATLCSVFSSLEGKVLA
jgi:hypothetical protein